MTVEQKAAAERCMRDASLALTCAMTAPHDVAGYEKHIAYVEARMVEARGYLSGHLVPPQGKLP